MHIRVPITGKKCMVHTASGSACSFASTYHLAKTWQTLSVDR